MDDNLSFMFVLILYPLVIMIFSQSRLKESFFCIFGGTSIIIGGVMLYSAFEFLEYITYFLIIIGYLLIIASLFFDKNVKEFIYYLRRF